MPDHPSSAGLAGRPLQQVGLTVRDLPSAVGFYKDVLGLPLLFEVGGMAFFDIAGVRLMLGEDKKRPEAPPTSILYFDDPAIAETAVKLEAHGVAFLGAAQMVQRTATHDLMLREFRDPDGNALALMGLVERATAAP